MGALGTQTLTTQLVGFTVGKATFLHLGQYQSILKHSFPVQNGTCEKGFGVSVWTSGLKLFALHVGPFGRSLACPGAIWGGVAFQTYCKHISKYMFSTSSVGVVSVFMYCF